MQTSFFFSNEQALKWPLPKHTYRQSCDCLVKVAVANTDGFFLMENLFYLYIYQFFAYNEMKALWAYIVFVVAKFSRFCRHEVPL